MFTFSIFTRQLLQICHCWRERQIQMVGSTSNPPDWNQCIPQTLDEKVPGQYKVLGQKFSGQKVSDPKAPGQETLVDISIRNFKNPCAVVQRSKQLPSMLDVDDRVQLARSWRLLNFITNQLWLNPEIHKTGISSITNFAGRRFLRLPVRESGLRLRINDSLTDNFSTPIASH